MAAAQSTFALVLLLSASAALGPVARAGGGRDRPAVDAHRIAKHSLQPYLRVLNIGDGSTALPAPPTLLQGGDRPASWPDPWRSHAAHPPLTYRKALWQIMSRRERLAVQFFGSQKDGPKASALNGGLHEGYGGASVAQLKDVKPASLLGTRHPFDVAIICAGVGDLYGHTEASRASEDLLTSLTQLVQSLHRRPKSNTTTLVCRLPLPEDGATCKVASGCPLLEAILKTNRVLLAWAADLERSTRRPVCTHCRRAQAHSIPRRRDGCGTQQFARISYAPVCFWW